MVMSKKNQMKFRLFEKNGSIRIAIQTQSETDDNSLLNTPTEYYVASDARNISRILDILVSTVKDVSIDGGNLCTNYRKNDIFIIEDYKRLKNYPELEPFFNKMGKKIQNQEEKSRLPKSKSSSKRKQIQFRKRLLVAATFMIGVITAGMFKSEKMFAREFTDDTFALDDTASNQEMEKHEVQEILRKYQASIVEDYSSMSDVSSQNIEPEISSEVESAPILEEDTEIVIAEDREAPSFESQEDVFQANSYFKDESIHVVPEEFEDATIVAMGNEIIEKEETEEKIEEKNEEEVKQEETTKNEEETKQEEDTKQEVSGVESVAEASFAKMEEELDQEIEQIALGLVAQNKTAEEDIKEAATTALQDGQAPIQVLSEETDTQVATVSVTEESTPIVSGNGTGIDYITTYHLTPEQIDVIKATIQHEAGFNPVEVEKVASTVINRCESGGWPGGTNPYGVIVGNGQFQSYYGGYYKQYLNGNYAEYTDEIVDAMLRGEQLPSHDFERFASGSNATGVQFTKKGNKYR